MTNQPPRRISQDQLEWSRGPASPCSCRPSRQYDRLLTVAQLQRTAKYIHFWLQRYEELRGRLIQFSKESPAHASMAADTLFSIENSIKVRRKQLDALLDERLMTSKQSAETALRVKVGKLPGTDPWQQLAKAAKREQELSFPYVFIEQRAGFNSQLYGYAMALVRAAAERTKPNAERPAGIHRGPPCPSWSSSCSRPSPSIRSSSSSPSPSGLERMREYLGPDYPLVQNLLKEDSPDSLAKQLLGATRLGDPAVRKALWEGGQAAIDASPDPLIRIAKLVDPEARALRKQYEDEYEAPNEAARWPHRRERFKAYGTSVYPDATFTLRLNYGTVQGWKENGKQVEPFTHLDKLYGRATGEDPFRVPDSWLKAKDKLDMNTPFNLSTNNDIVGGNSGSALINAKGEIVGLMFDGQHPFDRGFVLGRPRAEPLGGRASRHHPAGAHQGVRRAGSGEKNWAVTE